MFQENMRIVLQTRKGKMNNQFKNSLDSKMNINKTWE